jgi:putative flippase GtrA
VSSGPESASLGQTSGEPATGRTALRHGPRAVVTQVAKFGVVGAVAYVVDVGLFNLLVYAGGDGPLHDKPLTAKTISVVTATVVAYFGNRQWTFRHGRHRGFWREYGAFLVVNGISLIVALLPLAISRYVLGLDTWLADNISGNVIGLVLGMVVRFVGYRYWVFAVERPSPPSSSADASVGAIPR